MKMPPLLFFLMVIFISTMAFAKPPAPPSGWKKTSTGSSIDGTAVIGSANTTEGTAGEMNGHQIENDASETIDGARDLVDFLDETDGTEDSAVTKTQRVDGVECRVYYFRILTAAPTWTPCNPCITWADRATWDPAAKGSGGAYMVWWDGDSWEAIDGQAD